MGCCGILSKKIASIGVWGNGRFPQLNFPSAGAAAKQGYRFLFAYRDVSDCFYCWIDALIFSLKWQFQFEFRCCFGADSIKTA